MTLRNTFYSLFITALIIYILYIAQNLLIPFVLAVVIWYLMISIAKAIQAIPFVGQWVPYPLAVLGAFICSFAILWLLSTVVINNVTALVNLAPEYEQKLTTMVDTAMARFGVKNPPKIADAFAGLDFATLASSFAQTVSSLASKTGIIIIYILFLLLEQHSFDTKLEALISNKGKLEDTRGLITKIARQIQSYLRVKTFLSLLTASASYLVLKWIGVDFAEFWTMMIFLLNYIPTIGSIVATVFPCLLTLVQFGTLYPFLFVTLGLGSIQFVIGNILDPKMTGKSVNLSSLVILLSLSIWGTIWGVVGMFLCVPIMVIANIIFANFTQTRPIAIILSRDGKVT
ncbi:MAG: AI-2E family transporter [Chlamydiales bacterium]|nr:AI-2E family transporter [Chlamydiia bacterium]MCP5508280.1 AI-2E family transporter [Chlamydiales bacterium]